MPTQDFLAAIEQVEDKLGLSGQPRAIVFHEKQGRRHAHAVWSRTDMERQKAIQLSHTKLKLADLSRELYIKHGWQMPPGFMKSEARDWRNFTMAQWQQARRAGKDPREIKALLQSCWALSDTQASFRQALQERGYTLARGDRRGFVALDHRCEVFSISKKWIGKTAKDIRARLTNSEALPTVDSARRHIAQNMQSRLSELQLQHSTAIQGRLSALEARREQMTRQQSREREALQQAQAQRWEAEVKARQERFSKGLRGLLDRVTGRRRQIKQYNEREALHAQARDREEKDRLIFRHLEQRRRLQARMARLRALQTQRAQTLSGDMEQYRDIRQGMREKADFQRSRNRGDYGPAMS